MLAWEGCGDPRAPVGPTHGARNHVDRRARPAGAAGGDMAKHLLQRYLSPIMRRSCGDCVSKDTNGAADRVGRGGGLTSTGSNAVRCKMTAAALASTAAACARRVAH